MSNSLASVRNFKICKIRRDPGRIVVTSAGKGRTEVWEKIEKDESGNEGKAGRRGKDCPFLGTDALPFIWPDAAFLFHHVCETVIACDRERDRLITNTV